MWCSGRGHDSPRYGVAATTLWADLRAALRGTDADYTRIPLRRAVLLLAVPMMLELVLESTFAVVDIFFVATAGSSAVATVGLTETYLFLLYAIAMGLAMAVTAIVARRIGEHRGEEASLSAVQAIAVAVLVSLPFAAGGHRLGAGLLRLMGRRLGRRARLPLHPVDARRQCGDPAAVRDQRHLPRRRRRGSGDARAVGRQCAQHRARPDPDLRPRARSRRWASRARPSRPTSGAARAC
jgi:hypothetical protein